MDDYSPAPIAPQLEYVEQDEVPEELVAKDQRLAKSYFHPQWDGVQELMEDKIDSLDFGAVDPDLPAVEYKVTHLANKLAAAHLKDVLMQVKNAVTTTEGTKGDK